MAITPEYLMFKDQELEAAAELEAQIDKFLQETYKRPVLFVNHCPSNKWHSWTGEFFEVDEHHPAWENPNLQREVIRRFTSAGWICCITRKQIGLKPGFMKYG